MEKLTTIYKQLLNERLMDVDVDVNNIYNKYFKDDFDKIEVWGFTTEDMFKTASFDSSFLISPVAVKAHRLNPCHITINRMNGNNYNPSRKIINITVNKNAIDYIRTYDGNVDRATKYLDSTSSNNLRREFKETTIKGSIHHELSHWLDDTLHNSHILNRITKANQSGVGITKKGAPINADKLEIQSQIHNIKQLKNKYSDLWDYLTFQEMLNYSPALTIVYKGLIGDVRTKWVRDIKTRMYREGLLGKDMIN